MRSLIVIAVAALCLLVGALLVPARHHHGLRQSEEGKSEEDRSEEGRSGYAAMEYDINNCKDMCLLKRDEEIGSDEFCKKNSCLMKSSRKDKDKHLYCRFMAHRACPVLSGYYVHYLSTGKGLVSRCGVHAAVCDKKRNITYCYSQKEFGMTFFAQDTPFDKKLCTKSKKFNDRGTGFIPPINYWSNLGD